MSSREWRARHRFFVDTPLQIGVPCRLDGLERQLSSVLRLAPGDSIRLFNGDGREYLAIVRTLTLRQAIADVIDIHSVHTDPQVSLTLYQCTLKQDKLEWVLQKGTELGVARFAPVVSERSVVRPAAALHGKRLRWSAILREATEQCGRSRLPKLADAIDWPPPALAKGVHGFVAWEESSGAPSLGETVAALQPAEGDLSLALLIGPEGGLTGEEVEHLARNGWQIVSLGARTLRAETAAVAGIAIIMERCGEL